MISVAFIELPEEQRYKVKVDDGDIDTFIQEVDGKWQVIAVGPDGTERSTKRKFHSREGAALFGAFLHFERERRRLEGRR